jgi:tRNA1Val (adenine37-N6)-methyltransferase
MSNNFFKFKQFTVFQDCCAMKVGTDSVLLAAWTCVEQANRILDAGTGSGLLALMMAQKNPDAVIVAIDIDENAVLQAIINTKKSQWADRISVEHISLQNFTKQTKEKFDLIVCNPPFFINSLQNIDNQKTIARHTTRLSHSELLFCAEKLLFDNGKLAIVLPIAEGENCIELAKNYNLFCSKKTTVYPNPSAPCKRLLLEFIKNIESKTIITNKLTIETGQRHEYTGEFKLLVKDFYLNVNL